MSQMVRQNGQDFYVFEPAMLANHILCIPHRWYTRSGVMRGRAWRMIETQNFYCNGWLISDSDSEDLDIAVTDLVTSFPYLVSTFHVRGLLDPRNIIGEVARYVGPYAEQLYIFRFRCNR